MTFCFLFWADAHRNVVFSMSFWVYIFWCGYGHCSCSDQPFQTSTRQKKAKGKALICIRSHPSICGFIFTSISSSISLDHSPDSSISAIIILLMFIRVWERIPIVVWNEHYLCLWLFIVYFFLSCLQMTAFSSNQQDARKMTTFFCDRSWTWNICGRSHC